MPTSLDGVNDSPFIYASSERLGKGSFSQVFLCRQNGEAFALKIVDKTKLQNFQVKTATHLAMLSEVEALLELQHDCIVSLHDWHATPNEIYILMEHMPGGDLMAALQDGICLMEPGKRRLFRQLTFAVDYMHQQGFMHRDLKPENVLLTTRDR